jgi:NADPH-dependent curcumin reductase CurA
VTYFAEKLPQYRAQLTQLLSEGKIKNLCTVVPGLENAPKTFLKLFDGGNTGKLLVSISEPV